MTPVLLKQVAHAHRAWKKRWPEFFMEAAALGIFMISAGAFTVLFELPTSPVHLALPNGDLRRFLIGIAMGATAVTLIYSPWGQRSGAHMNPAVTLTFLWLKKIPLWDAIYYMIFQTLGGIAGVLLTWLVLGRMFTDAPVSFVTTTPAHMPHGQLIAFVCEGTIAFIMMTMIMNVSTRPEVARFTGIFAGCLIVCYVTFEAPISGFGMNPARTIASALPSGNWDGIWLYLIAPPLGMMAAAWCFLYLRPRPRPGPTPNSVPIP